LGRRRLVKKSLADDWFFIATGPKLFFDYAEYILIIQTLHYETLENIANYHIYPEVLK
jgi:hypothetical protein